MAIKIIKKSNKVSNKTHTGGKNPLDDTKEPLTPFIDKISLIVTPPNEEDAYSIHSGIWTHIQETSVFQNAQKKSGFSLVKLISLKGTEQRPHFSYRYADKKADKIRIELNPRKVGPSGMADLHAVLTTILPGGWQYFVKYGHITRIDIAVDLPEVRMDGFLFLPHQAMTTREWRRDGHLETLRFGKPQGNQSLIYSVKNKRLGKQQFWAGNSVVRVERRLRNPSPKKFAEIGNLKNPFASLQLTHKHPLPPTGEKAWQWAMFEDSVNVRGLTQALALIPEDRRKKYRAHIKKNLQPWWDPEAIWSSWPLVCVPLLGYGA